MMIFHRIGLNIALVLLMLFSALGPAMAVANKLPLMGGDRINSVMAGMPCHQLGKSSQVKEATQVQSAEMKQASLDCFKHCLEMSQQHYLLSHRAENFGVVQVSQSFNVPVILPYQVMQADSNFMATGSPPATFYLIDIHEGVCAFVTNNPRLLI